MVCVQNRDLVYLCESFVVFYVMIAGAIQLPSEGTVAEWLGNMRALSPPGFYARCNTFCFFLFHDAAVPPFRKLVERASFLDISETSGKSTLFGHTGHRTFRRTNESS